MDKELQAAAAKVGIAATGLGTSATFLGLDEKGWAIVASVATVSYVLAQAFFLLRDKWWRDRRGK